MTWQRTLDIGHDKVTVTVDGTYVQIDMPDGDLLTPIDATELADTIKRAARFASRERQLASTSRRRSA